MKKKHPLTRRSFLAGAAVGLALPAPAEGLPAAPAEPPAAPVVLPTIDSIWREEPVVVGLRKQLLVDDDVLAHKHNVSREYGRATKVNGGKPVLEPTEPWENIYFAAWLTVLHDGKKFQMWYCAFNYCMAYAESADGIRWVRPNLGLYDFDPARVKFDDEFGRAGGFIPYPGRTARAAGKRNNLVGDFGHQFTLMRDPHETDRKHLYKAVCSHPNARARSQACLLHSPDGLTGWEWYNNGEPVTGRASDTLNQILWDEEAKVYRLYTRQDFGTPGGRTEFRGTRHMTNPDVKRDPTAWKTVRKWELDRDGPGERLRRQIMSFNNWIYEGVHFGFLQCHEYPAGIEAVAPAPKQPRRPERDVNNYYVCPCRDGDRWDLSAVYAEKRLIERGPDGSFDQGYLAPGPTPVTWDDRHWFFYGGWPTSNATMPPSNAIGAATLRLDGFLYLEPWIRSEPGWVITRPFRLEGGRLEVNADARGGSLGVEVLGGDTGEPLPGFSRKEGRPLTGDGVRLRPRWDKQADLASLKGKVVRLKFHLDGARLYAFQVRS